MLNFATFDLLTQVIPPATYESCRAQIPKEFGTLNLTRSSVALYKYQQEKLKSDNSAILNTKTIESEVY